MNEINKYLLKESPIQMTSDQMPDKQIKAVGEWAHEVTD